MNTSTNSVYLSKILNLKIYDNNNAFIGKLNDIGIVSEELKKPYLSIAKIILNNKFTYLDWNCIEISFSNGNYSLKCISKIEKTPDSKILFLKKFILDKQIIDINGKKVVRVNDIKLVPFEKEWVVVAVDIGVKGLLRRLGVSNILSKTLKTFNKEISSNLILWNDIEAFLPNNDNIVLSKNYKKLAKLHTSDLADILEDFDTNTSMAIISSLDTDSAAGILEEIEPNIKKKIMKTLPLDKAADILEEMPTDEVVDILQDLNENQAEELLNNMEISASKEIRELLEYKEDTAGSIMSKDFITYPENALVSSILADFRSSKIDDEVIFYIYIVDSNKKLTGVVSLRNLIAAAFEATMSKIMVSDYIYVEASESIHELLKIITKYNLTEIPVITKDKQLLGCILINDIIDELVKNKKIKI